MPVVNHIDLDGLVPKRIIDDIKSYEDWQLLKAGWQKDHVLPFFPPFSHGYGFSRVGFMPTKLLDWRALERRSQQLHVEAQRWRSAFWDALRGLHKQATKQKLKKVWVVNDNDVLVFDGTGLTRESSARLVSDTAPHPKKKMLVVTGEVARKINRINERSNTFATRDGAYARAFRQAVEARLRSFIDVNGLMNKEHCYFQPTVFVINNDDRQYVVKLTTQGVLGWDGETLYACD
jgi:hypothetical protein